MRGDRGIVSKGQVEFKGASFSWFALQADLSFVRLHGQPAKSQTEPGGMALVCTAVGLPKFLEDVLVLVRRNPLAVIAH